jgi:hypothetical protein
VDSGAGRNITHLVRLPTLQSQTTYHFQMRSRDSAGNLAAFSDYTFTAQ